MKRGTTGCVLSVGPGDSPHVVSEALCQRLSLGGVAIGGPVVRVICPTCATSTTAPTPEEAGSCPQCGRWLGEAKAEPADSDAADQVLIADLREAFGAEARVLGPDDARRVGAGMHSSTAFSRELGQDALPPGSRLGDFEILGELGRGGMGVVYRARQVSLGREVALKVLPGYARYGRSGVQRFQVEAQAAARLHHTNVVPIYAQGEHEGCFYYAMELVDGVSLDAVIRGEAGGPSPGSGPADRHPQLEEFRPWGSWTRADYARLARLVAEVADGLEHAHRHDVIHRDVKPHNLLLGTDRRLHLTDFGLARLTDQPHLTVSGEIMGTPAYLSPEQVRGRASKIDRRTDIYSLGVTLYELITRHKPFDGETREQVIDGICTAEPVAPQRLNPRIPLDLETICLRAMEKDPQRRHPSAALLAEDLRRFSEGRPILSRRVTRVERAIKWVRRHKALTAALAATVAVVTLAGGWAWSAQNTRQREAGQLLGGAYEQLAYFDYRAPELVEADLERAELLGTDPTELELLRGLANAGVGNYAAAVEHLETALEDEPTDQRAWYLLAWAQQKDDPSAARTAFENAEQLGPPATADAWFFRGIAIHFDKPLEAIESYRQAVALRTRQHAFYPQAVLHLARARNQLLYKMRNLETFDEADAGLRQLVEHGYYGAYPYYLLSIAHRLAAEIYQGSSGTRDDSLVDEHYNQALEWARLGQEIEPDDDEPFTAEAECLESMGRFAEAIESRDRSIEAATRERRRWEGYHYRWRLHYWMGDFEAALQDLVVCAGYAPQSRFYAHVYPALVQAESGNMAEALAHARALADEVPESAQAVLWSATCLRLLGRPEEADELLTDRAEALDFAAELVPPQSEQWMRTLYAYCRRGGPLTTLETLAREAESPWKLWGEASFHAAALRLSDGDRRGALEDFTRAYRSFDGEQGYTYHAKTICQKMRHNPAWPPWIEVSWGEAEPQEQE